MSEPSEVSSSSGGDNVDKEKASTPRGAAPVELTDLPDLMPTTINPEDRAREELEPFWQHNPVDDDRFDNLSVDQLAEVEKWAREVNHKFSSELEKLRNELRAEWWAKEQVLDQLLQASIGDPLKTTTH